MKLSSFAASAISGALLGLAHTAEAADPVTKPDVIRWGASAAEIEAALKGKCAKGFKQRPIDPPFLPRISTRQVQIDCDGLMYMGAPRWAEFVIGDDRLQMVWIMVRPEDQAAITAAMERAYGPAPKRNGAYIAYPALRTAWRFKPAEVLFYAPELDADMAPDFEPEAP